MSLTFRPLQWIDAMALFVWRTDPETVKWSLNQPPTWEEHLRWMNKEVASSWATLYIGCHDPGTPVVVVSYLNQDINITVNPEVRQKGYGAEAIRFVQNRLDHLTARIILGNTASLKLFSKCGFQITDMDDKGIIMEWRKA